MKFERVDLSSTAAREQKAVRFPMSLFTKKKTKSKVRLNKPTKKVIITEETRVFFDHVKGTDVTIRRKGVTKATFNKHNETNRYGVVLPKGKYTVEVKHAT